MSTAFCGARTFACRVETLLDACPAVTGTRFDAQREINALPPIFRGAIILGGEVVSACLRMAVQWRHGGVTGGLNRHA